MSTPRRGPGGKFLPKDEPGGEPVETVDPATSSEPSSSSSPPPEPSGSSGESPAADAPASPPPRDKRPRGRRRSTSRARTKPTKPAPAITTTQIRDALAELLTAPGIAYQTFGLTWPAHHVVATGPELAQQLAIASEHSPWLRSKLEAVARGENALGVLMLAYGLTMAGATYLIPQLVYFGVLPTRAGQAVGVAVPTSAEADLQSRRAAASPPHHPAADARVPGAPAPASEPRAA